MIAGVRKSLTRMFFQLFTGKNIDKLRQSYNMGERIAKEALAHRPGSH